MARLAEDLARVGVGAGDVMLVAVSGGADSLALLLLAHAALGNRCVAATVDHGLRAAAADEAAYVARLCAERRIAHAVLAAPLPARAGGTANVSARARALRYRLLEAHADAIGAAAIATAHHADDQVETIAMRLNRGAGLAGLAGVRARSGRVVRPLLAWRRAELAAIVADCGVTAVADPSNSDDRYDRARLRKALTGADWIDAARWERSAAALADADQALEWAVVALAGGRCTFADGVATLVASGLPDELLRRLVLRCLAHVDPAIVPRGPDVTRLIARLCRGGTATLGGAAARAVETMDAPGQPSWIFVAAPPHRSH